MVWKIMQRRGASGGDLRLTQGGGRWPSQAAGALFGKGTIPTLDSHFKRGLKGISAGTLQ